MLHVINLQHSDVKEIDSQARCNTDIVKGSAAVAEDVIEENVVEREIEFTFCTFDETMESDTNYLGNKEVEMPLSLTLQDFRNLLWGLDISVGNVCIFL
jgi:hypothetical protein